MVDFPCSSPVLPSDLRMSKKRSVPKKTVLSLGLLCCGLASIPLLALIAFVARYGVDMPNQDQWEFIPLLQKFYQGNITFYGLWQQHNEHRIFFPRIVFLVLARLTHWNIRYELAANMVVAFGTFMVIACQVRKTAVAIAGRYLIWTIPVISLIAFSLAQHENWLWGWELQIFMNLLAVVAGIVLLTGGPFRWSRLAFSMLLGIVATYSFSNGAVYWPLGLVLLLFAGPEGRKPKVAACLVWTAVGALTMASYLYHWHTNPAHPSLLYIFRHPLDYTEYVLLFLGAPCRAFGGKALCISAGIIGLLLAIVGPVGLARRRKVEWYVLWPYIGLTLYAVATAAITGLARAGFGSDQALSSRYITVSSLLWIADVVFLSLVAKFASQKKSSYVAAGAVVVIALLAGISSARSIPSGAERRSNLSTVRHEMIVLQGIYRPDAENAMLGYVYPKPEVAYSRLWILQKYHLSLYRPNTDYSDVL